jgi:hypothetical protein
MRCFFDLLGQQAQAEGCTALADRANVWNFWTERGTYRPGVIRNETTNVLGAELCVGMREFRAWVDHYQRPSGYAQWTRRQYWARVWFERDDEGRVEAENERMVAGGCRSFPERASTEHVRLREGGLRGFISRHFHWVVTSSRG